MMALAELETCAHGLGPHDWHAFAERVACLDKVLGAFEGLHADAADGSSPVVSEWPQYALRDAQKLEACGIETADEARAYWFERYGVGHGWADLGGE